METRCVFFDVETEFLNITSTSFGPPSVSINISKFRPEVAPSTLI
jgi:hypothetical protein